MGALNSLGPIYSKRAEASFYGKTAGIYSRVASSTAPLLLQTHGLLISSFRYISNCSAPYTISMIFKGIRLVVSRLRQKDGDAA